MLKNALAAFRRPKQISLEDYLEKIKKAGLDEQGRQVVSSTPMAPPIGHKPQPSLAQLIREMVQSEQLAQAVRNSGHETFEESEDFDIPDEPEQMRSEWENEFDPPLSELLQAGQQAIQERESGGGAGGSPPAQTPLQTPSPVATQPPAPPAAPPSPKAE